MNSYLFVQANVRKCVSRMIIYRHTDVHRDKYYCISLYFVYYLFGCSFVHVSFVYHKW